MECEHIDEASEDLDSLINLVAQIAHSAAQGKIGSGFDISCGVFGSQLFTRIPASKIQEMQGKLDAPASSQPFVRDFFAHHTEQIPRPLRLTVPESLQLLMLEYSCGTDTRLAVKQVTDHLKENESSRVEFLRRSKQAAEEMGLSFTKIGSNLGFEEVRQESLTICSHYRRLMKSLGEEAKVDIEPDIATSLLDKILAVGNVWFACCPGAGGYDALAIVADTREPRELLKSKIMAAAISIKEPVDTNTTQTIISVTHPYIARVDGLQFLDQQLVTAED